jgi:DNA-binding response OmpR family regulator
MIKKVLLAEDDANLGKILKAYLQAKKYEVTLSVNGNEALDNWKNEAFDIVILDVMMPLRDGFSVAAEIRKSDDRIPIIFLTAKSLEEDKLRGFKTGADDYITKPFSMDVLLARMEAILRRTQKDNPSNNTSALEIGDYVYDYDHQKLTFDGVDQKLTSKENELLKLLYEYRNEVLDRKIALNRIWKDDSYFNARSMDVYITKLRKYLKQDEKLQIVNVHGVGFKLLTK